MSTRVIGRRPAAGQILTLFALATTVIFLIVALVVDGGNALVQRRSSQNAADLAALSGARVVASWVDKDFVNGTDANVAIAIQTSNVANGAETITFGGPPAAPASPYYVNEAGSLLAYVGNGSIPAGTVGVTVPTITEFDPYFLGMVGMQDWKASAVATARGGYAAGGPSGDVFPVGVSYAFFQSYPFCTGEVGSGPDCAPQKLTPGHLNVPGGFGWLKFGADGFCTGYGLGMDPNAGCDSSKPFLQEQIGPPANSFGCCDAPTGGPAPEDRIGSHTGNKASADCSYYIDNDIVVTVPVFDDADSQGSHGWYHIIGFAGFQLTDCNGGKDIQGVWRKQIFLGPTTATAGYEFTSLAVQLVK